MPAAVGAIGEPPQSRYSQEPRARSTPAHAPTRAPADARAPADSRAHTRARTHPRGRAHRIGTIRDCGRAERHGYRPSAAGSMSGDWWMSSSREEGRPGLASTWPSIDLAQHRPGSASTTFRPFSVLRAREGVAAGYRWRRRVAASRRETRCGAAADGHAWRCAATGGRCRPRSSQPLFLCRGRGLPSGRARVPW